MKQFQGGFWPKLKKAYKKDFGVIYALLINISLGFYAKQIFTEIDLSIKKAFIRNLNAKVAFINPSSSK